MCGRNRDGTGWFVFSSRRRHTIWTGDWSSDVCSSDLRGRAAGSKSRRACRWLRPERCTHERGGRVVARQCSDQRIVTRAAEDRLAVLTQREREVLALVGHGLSNDEIGAELFLSPATARTHVSHAMVKLGARDRAQLVVIAYQTGLVSPRP